MVNRMVSMTMVEIMMVMLMMMMKKMMTATTTAPGDGWHQQDALTKERRNEQAKMINE